jgi:putative FmdB family regulatory protein
LARACHATNAGNSYNFKLFVDLRLAMPIYVYKCGSCGFVEEKLQKLSDPAPTVCPSCGASALAKQVTAAGFELKGSGWYVTDFRNEGSGSHGTGDSAANVPSHSVSDAASANGGAPKPAAAAAAKPAGKKAATAPSHASGSVTSPA